MRSLGGQDRNPLFNVLEPTKFAPSILYIFLRIFKNYACIWQIQLIKECKIFIILQGLHLTLYCAYMCQKYFGISLYVHLCTITCWDSYLLTAFAYLVTNSYYFPKCEKFLKLYKKVPKSQVTLIKKKL